ncbi:MAG TPA: indolepyruvate oxidoreductase subunit beta family protein [Steroidobacteraceae bacterium]|nr:indolepyruvate oxidoreductase subunit beta family protein [Steroidobacteraceae bacterium]
MTEGVPGSERPIKLTIAALGGQGGGVLATWLIQIAEAEGHLAQSTSVPGVAQRTGATIYYLEFFPRAAAERAGREPIMALMPVAGDVDCVVASELAEAGRAIQRGLVTPDRTTLIASSHRSYAIGEKSAMGRGAVDPNQLIDLVRSQAKRLILFDMDAVAEQHHSVVSSVLLGALCGSGVLPFGKPTFEAVIKSSGIAVKTNLAAFEDAYKRAQQGDSGQTVQGPKLGEVPVTARTPELQPLLDRVRKFAPTLQPLVFEGVRRQVDYQDPAYADLYLKRVERIAAIDGSRAATGVPAAGADSSGWAGAGGVAEVTAAPWALTEATARNLALWMSFEDTIRVADLKTRPARFTRVREEIRAAPDQLFGITEFMKPRVAEIAGTLPAGVGRWILGSPRVSGWFSRWTGGKQIRTSTIRGFLMLHALASLRRWRRGTLRFREENSRIEEWLARIERLAANNYALAVELARAQRLVKGYGETHERGWKNFSALVERLEVLAARPDGAAVLARLQDAALADEAGQALARELAQIGIKPETKVTL